LAIRLPQAVVDAVNLKEGDQVEISVTGKRDFKTDHDRRRERALEVLMTTGSGRWNQVAAESRLKVRSSSGRSR
jgi:antitoxin component of MazEF toxin-antitoxin module